MAIIKELQKVAPFGRIENRQPPVVEDEELNATDGFEQAAIAAVASSEGERLEQARDAMILDRAIVAASFVTEGASNRWWERRGIFYPRQVCAGCCGARGRFPESGSGQPSKWDLRPLYRAGE